MLSKIDQANYEATILEVVARMRAHDFANNYELASTFNREPTWACHMRALILKRGLMTADEWSSSFTKRNAKTKRWRCAECGSVKKRVQQEERYVSEQSVYSSTETKTSDTNK